MNMRAKFVVSGVEKQNESEILSMQAVTSGSEENKSFSLWTPSASLSMTITNPALHDKFKNGQEFYVDFTLAE